MQPQSSAPASVMRSLVTSALTIVKQAGVLAMGHVGAQALMIIVSPVLTRLFTPADLGTFGVIVAIMAVPAAVANANFDQAIVLPRNERSAAHIAAMAGAAVLALGLLVLILAIVAQDWLASHGLADVLWFGAPWLVGFGIFRILDQWAVRGEQFGRSAMAQGIRTAGMLAAQCLGGLFVASPAVLLAGQLFGQWLGTSFLLRGGRRWLSSGWLNLARLRALARKYRAFPMFGSPQALVNEFAIHIPTFLFGLLLGPAAAGQYWLAFRTLMVPSTLMERGLRTAFYRGIAGKAQRHEGFLGDVVSVTGMLAAVGLIPLVSIWMFGPQIFVVVFGNEWEVAGQYGRWLVVWWFCGLINLPSVAAIPIVGLQRAFFIYEVCFAVSRVAAVVLGSMVGPLGAVVAFSLTGALFNLALIVYVHRAVWRAGGKCLATDEVRPDVAFFLPSVAGDGAQRITLAVGEVLARQGVRVDLVIVRREGILLDRIPKDVHLIDLQASRMLAAVPALALYLRRAQPRVLMPTITVANVIALIARWLAGVPTRVVVRQATHLSASRKVSDSAKMRLIAWMGERMYRMADGAVAISKGVGDDLAAHAGIVPERLTVIYNPINVEAVQRAARDDPGHPWLRDSIPVILAVGRLTYQKDFSTLLRAFARLRAMRPARLIVLGQGEDRAALDSLAAGLGVAGDVAFPGYTTNPFAYMARAQVFVLSSRWEGFGNVLVEALACGLPVVSTDCPSGPREILDDGAFGALVPVGDDRAMAAAIAEAIDHPPPTERQWARATCFAPAAIMAQYAEVLGVGPVFGGAAQSTPGGRLTQSPTASTPS